MGMYDIPERAALNMVARMAMKAIQCSEALSAMTAGTVYTGTLSIAPIVNSKKQFVGLHGDSGFTPDGSVFKTEKSTADGVTTNGDYFIDYMTGYYKVKAGASATPTVTWYVLAPYMAGANASPFSYGLSSVTSVTITHNLGYIPQVWICDSSGNILMCDITHNSINDFTLEFAEAQSGTVYYR